MLNKLTAPPARKAFRLRREDALKHVVRVSTIVARASFWALCFHYFGAEALLSAVAAWAFLIGAKDLTFARVRLANMARPEKRRSALTKSIALELFILALRLVVLALIAWLVRPIDAAVTAVVVGLMLCAPFWARETMATLSKVQRVNWLNRYVTLTSSLAGLGAIILFARAGLEPLRATVIALVLREAVTFFGFIAMLVLGRLGLFRDKDVTDEAEEGDDDGGMAVAVIGPDGTEIQSTFKRFLADNFVHSRWKASQLGTRIVANGLLGPFGSIVTRIVYAYRQPGPYVHDSRRMPFHRVALLAVLIGTIVVIGGYLASRSGLLDEYGIMVGAIGFRAVALVLNLLLWQRLSLLVGEDVKARFGRWRRAQPAKADTSPPAD